MIGCSSASLKLQTDASALTPHSDAAMYTATLSINDNIFPRYDVHYEYISGGGLLFSDKNNLVHKLRSVNLVDLPFTVGFCPDGEYGQVPWIASYFGGDNSKKLYGTDIYVLIKHCGGFTVPASTNSAPWPPTPEQF